MTEISKMITAVMEYDAGDPRRVHHLLKVYAFAKALGEAEGLDVKTQRILELAAVLHDIGIHEAEQKHGSSAGKFQEIEGPAIAGRMLQSLGTDDETMGRVCYLIAHHHTYQNVDGIDYQILIEADFLVNAYEDRLDKNAVRVMKDRIFKTKTGLHYLEKLYLEQ